ncbi:MAG: YceI family protein [Chlorobi bacterium]|nr:YceI family protein [Chlorobiota bacterium]
MIRYLLLFIFLPAITAQSFAFAPANGRKNDTVNYRIDTLKSKIFWKCDVHHGYVLIKEGWLKTVGHSIVSGEITVKMDSIVDLDIDYALMKGTLENVLRSDVFFDVKNFPEAKFRVAHTEKLSDTSFQITGDLNIRGIDNCIIFNTTTETGRDSLIIKSEEFTINRLNWGITAYSAHVVNSDDSFVVSDGIDFTFVLVGYRVD